MKDLNDNKRDILTHKKYTCDLIVFLAYRKIVGIRKHIVFSWKVQITNNKGKSNRAVCSAIAPDVKLSRQSTIERKIYDISHFPLNTKHRAIPFGGETWGCSKATVTRSWRKVRDPPSEGCGIVYFLIPIRSAVCWSEDGLHYSGWFILFGCAHRRISRDSVECWKQNVHIFLHDVYIFPSSFFLFLLVFYFFFLKKRYPSSLFSPAESRFHRLKPAHKTVAVFQRRKVLTFWLFDLQPLLEIQRATMT